MAKYNKTQGTTIAYGSGSPLTYTAVKNVTSISEGGAQASEIDITNLDSTAMENIPGLVDYGSLNVAINWDFDDATHTHLQDSFDDQVVENWKITFKDGSPAKTATFQGYIQSMTREHAINSIVKAQLTLRITGPVTVA